MACPGLRAVALLAAAMALLSAVQADEGPYNDTNTCSGLGTKTTCTSGRPKTGCCWTNQGSKPGDGYCCHPKYHDDDHNCGSCGKKCPETMHCVNMQCVCKKKYYMCNGKCIPKSTCCTSPDSCPGAGQSCPYDGGQCVCADGYYMCQGSCILKDRCCKKPDKCPDNSKCPQNGGTCECKKGWYKCNGVCIPKGKCCTNPDNCHKSTCPVDGGDCPDCHDGDYLCNGFCIPKGKCCTKPDSCPGDHNTCPCDGGDCPGCDKGYYNCNGVCIPDGTCCTNPDNCPGANSYCEVDAGNCVCDDGWADCDKDLANVLPTDGCEISTDFDNKNCGACGQVCPSGYECIAGVCAEAAVKCDSTLKYSGADGTSIYSVTIGTGGPHFNFTYETYSVPDHLIVTDSKGTVLFDKIVGDNFYCSLNGCTSWYGCTTTYPPTGCYCGTKPGKPVTCSCSTCSCPGTSQGPGGGWETLSRASGVSVVQVKVIGGCGTRWDFRVGCAV